MLLNLSLFRPRALPYMCTHENKNSSFSPPRKTVTHLINLITGTSPKVADFSKCRQKSRVGVPST